MNTSLYVHVYVYVCMCMRVCVNVYLCDLRTFRGVASDDDGSGGDILVVGLVMRVSIIGGGVVSSETGDGGSCGSSGAVVAMASLALVCGCGPCLMVFSRSCSPCMSCRSSTFMSCRRFG